MDRSVVALLLAKGTSKRLPGKNLKDFNGKPTFLWNVEKCLKLFKKVYVSSDSEVILQIAKDAGAIPIKRGEELCGDVPDIPVFQHAYQEMGEVFGVVAVHANNPTIHPGLIERVKYLIELGAPEVMTCYPMTHGDVYKDQHNKVNGSIRGFSATRLLTYKDPYKPNPEVLLVDHSIEIETQESFDQAVCQFKLQS
jgi:CMP-N-acetylneuraminic acid synthetase